MASSKEIKEEYTSSLADLTFNSKPLISVLTMLAEENTQHAKDIVEAIETHLAKVRTEVKLPILYLIDCIIKNVGGPYMPLFCQNIVPTFCNVFQSVDERTRAEMFKLRQTWNDVLPALKLFALDVQINRLDPAWPVTATAPNNSIHLNPKFLRNQVSGKKESTTATTTSASKSSTGALDPTTLDMQQQLINKQKQLLELQQKKLELELLQTKVKLQEQLKNTNPTAVKVTAASNLLLKPEVAKQMVTKASVGKSGVTVTLARPKTTTTTTASFGQRLQSSVPRIAPVNSALVAAARPIRDPRLLRQHQKQTNIVNTNVQLESKPQQIDSDNKIVNSKMSVRDNNRTEPRLVSNKDEKTPQEKAKPPSLQRTFNKSRKSLKVSSRSLKSSESDSKTDSSKGSTSSLDSPVKSKSDVKITSPTKSPSKHKKKDSVEKKLVKSPKSEPKTVKSEPSPTFKDVKISAKNRNYMRRNRKASVSPEPTMDVDLRTVAAAIDKLPRPQPDSDDKSDVKGMDVDLRQLPAVISKKRPSTDGLESDDPKKRKAFDVLFGHEDTDLRQLPVVISSPPPERPPTPPPPIISTQGDRETNGLKSSPAKSKLDVVRAKLANATKEKTTAFTSTKGEATQEDTDLREFSPRTSPNKRKSQIIISSADAQCIQTGNMTKEQEKALMNKIIAQIETEKLREAQQKESETLGDLTLQQISDEELNGDSDDDVTEVVAPKPQTFGDKDERVPPMHMPLLEEPYQKYPNVRRPILTRRGVRRRHYENPHVPYAPRAGVRPWQEWGGRNSGPWRPMGHAQTFVRPHFNAPTDENATGSPKESDLIVDSNQNQDNHKMINIDGVPRDIRYYDDAAVIFLNWDDPRDVAFQNGSRGVSFNDDEYFTLSFGEPYREVTIDGDVHRVKLGGPTRELFVDGKWYECIFGGPTVAVDLNGKVGVVKLDGPPPQVKIGTERRTDIVCGKINLIIDAKTIVPVFLDGTTQKFEVEGNVHTLRFVDSLRRALINDIPFKVTYGGLPKPVMLNNKKHFVRFSVLPRGIKPGHVRIKDMEMLGAFESPLHEQENSQDGPVMFDGNVDANEPALPIFSKKRAAGGGNESPDRNSNSPHMFQTIMQQQNFNNLDVLSSVMSSAMTSTGNEGGYQVENRPETEVPTISQPISAPASVININDLFQKLVATGIVTTAKVSQKQAHRNASSAAKGAPVRNHLSNVRRVTFAEPEMLKIRQPPVFLMLYAGMQCSSCGMRFPPEQSILYSQHLDWHFRQNRKGKKNIRKAASRRWYYSLEDWKNYEEIEDLEEREKSFFDQQQSQLEGAADETEEEVEIPTVPADPDIQEAHCDYCQDKFELFYNEEKEEWQLRMAVRIGNKTYHPICYEDYQTSLNVPIDISAADVKELEKLEEKEKHIPGLEIVLDDDEDDKVKTPVALAATDDNNKETDEESKPVEKMEEDEPTDVFEDDDDVIIHEVVPEKIVLDDDDEAEDDIGLLPGVVVKQEPVDDGFIDVTGAVVKVKVGEIKTEPTEIDLEMLGTSDASSKPEIDTTHAELVSSIDGNVELEGNTPATSGIGGKIKFNISKSLAVAQPKETVLETEVSSEMFIDPSQPLPPGEEPIQLNLKPALQGVELKRLAPVKKGAELTGLCSIM